MAASICKDNITTDTTDDRLLRELDQLSLSSAPSETYCEQGHSESTLKGLYGCFQAQKLCDVTLIAGGCRISAHRVVLASCSEYYAAMFTGALKEAQLSEITIGNVDSRVLQALVHYCYTGTIELNEETVELLLSTARLLQFDRVANACCAYLQKYLDPCNCLGIALFAEQQYCMDLHEEALKYTFKNLMQVVKQQEFLALQVDQLTALLTSDFSIAVTEQNLFESLIAWVQHDSANREQHLAASLKFIKLHLLPPEYLLDNVENACSNVPECLPLIVKAMKRRLLPELQGSAKPAGSSSSTGGSVGRLYAIGGTDPANSTGTINIEMYTAESGSWCPLEGVKGAARWWFGGAVLQNRFIAVGGRDSQYRVLNTVERFELSDTMDGEWSMLAPLNTRRRWPGVAVLGAGTDASVYVVGGADDSNQHVATVERWDARSGTWTLVAPMRNGRSGCGVAALRGRLYAVGGYNDSYLNSVECYDPNTNRWSNCAPMSCNRNSVSVCAANGCLYAIGGCNSLSNLASVERYDPVADAWTTVAPLSRARRGVASCLMGDRIVAVGGGEGSNDYQPAVEVYNLASDCWQVLAPLTAARRCAAVAYVPPC